MITVYLSIALTVIVLHCPLTEASSADPLAPVTDAVTKLVQFCIEPKGSVDEHAIATLVDYVLSPKQNKESALPKLLDSTGAYYEFDMKTTFSRFMEYSYNPYIPPIMTRPSSQRYSIWSSPRVESQRLPSNWKLIPSGGAPLVIHGAQHESDTPDLNTAVYHEYDLKRTLIVVNYKGRQVLISVSKQTNKSNVGKKGVILGNDSGWSYYYTGEPGTPKTGLGWVKSYIYDFFSVGVYVESGASPITLRTGVFQWLRAGWTGINFVKSNHIIFGMKRFARDCRGTLESPLLPAPGEMVSVYQWLSSMPAEDLKNRYASLQKGQRSSAVQSGQISKSGEEEQVSFANTPKEQMLQELMLEYLKVSLGKPTVLGKQAFTLAPTRVKESRDTH